MSIENGDQTPDEMLPALSVIKSIFDDFGLTDLDDNVYIHVMDIISTYTGELLSDAKSIALASNHSQVNEDDIALSIEDKMDELVFTPLHRDLLLEYAEKINSQPLPPIKSGSTLRLAPDKFTTTAPNYAIVMDPGSKMLNHPLPVNISSRLVVPNTNAAPPQGNLSLYRVTNPSGVVPRPTLISGSTTGSTNPVGTLGDLSSSGIHVIGATQSASSSLIRVHSSNFGQPAQSQMSGGLPNSTSTGNVITSFKLR
ncbi:unnamed protein product [Hymenolepis diminuta]|uniref:Transcription initiation factor TFIID subunit 9 n=1 Tax=Hymenolepis diminuta TaxID=6216 RepID=A0A0R3SSY5_HYMDI|nr:unnamed protein product [Hymenolepis diminuta]